MSSMRRSTFVLALAAARLRRRAGVVLLAAAGIAAGAATLATVLAAGAVAQDQSLGRAVLALPPEQRVVRASWFGAYSSGLDGTVFKALHGISPDRSIRALLFRQTSVDGKVFNLGAADHLRNWVRLRSGRLPRVCSPRLCEVLQVAGSGPIPDVPGLRLRRAGRGDLVSSVPFLQTSAYGRTVEDSYSFTSPNLAPPFLLTNDVSAAAALPLFRLIHRSYGWILPLGRHSVHPWSLDALSAKIARARSTLTTSNDFFDLSDPISQLAPTVSANKATGRRLLLVGGQAAALLLAFVVLAAVGALVAIALAFARGAADATTVAREGGTGVVLFLLPALVAFVAAVLAVRLLGPALRGLERLARRMPVSARLAALSLARNPGYAGAAAALLLVSVGLAAFSVDYRSTLRRAQSDQARFETPADIVLSQTGGGPALDHLVPTGAAKRAIPVLRVDAQVGSGAGSKDVTVLGRQNKEIRTRPFWRADFASSSLGRLADRVDPGGRVALDAVRLPARARTLAVSVTDRGDPAVATANIATEGGTFVTLDLGTIEPGSSVLRGPIPASARGGLLIGLGFAPTLPEVHNARPASGTLLLGPFRADGAVLRAGFASWVATGGMHLRHSAERARLSFFLTNDRDAGFRHSQPTDGGHVRAIATPSLAGLASGGGLLPVRVDDNDVVLRVAGTAERFPSTDGDFLVADESALRTLLNTSAPGSAVVREVWLDGASGRAGRELAAAVGKPPLTGVHATFQSRVEAGLRDDPLARAVLRTLAATALVAFALALGGLLLALAEDVRDERGELEDLEAQGAGPARLRGHVRLRSTAIVGVGILGGAVLGAVLSVLVVAAVLVTANGGVPEPPLLLSVDWTLLGAGLLAYLACALVLVSLVTWNAFRREAP